VYIADIICPPQIEEKLEAKHGVHLAEAVQVVAGYMRLRFVEKGDREGEDVYVAFGRTLGGRYLPVFFVYKPNNVTAIIVSAREMTDAERRTYRRK
jgi:uncharacterized protein